MRGFPRPAVSQDKPGRKFSCLVNLPPSSLEWPAPFSASPCHAFIGGWLSDSTWEAPQEPCELAALEVLTAAEREWTAG